MARRSRCNPSKQLTMKAAVESGVLICLNCFAVAAYRCGLCDEQCLLCCQHSFGQALEQCQHGFYIIGPVSQTMKRSFTRAALLSVVSWCENLQAQQLCLASFADVLVGASTVGDYDRQPGEIITDLFDFQDMLL